MGPVVVSKTVYGSMARSHACAAGWKAPLGPGLTVAGWSRRCAGPPENCARYTLRCGPPDPRGGRSIRRPCRYLSAWKRSCRTRNRFRADRGTRHLRDRPRRRLVAHHKAPPRGHENPGVQTPKEVPTERSPRSPAPWQASRDRWQPCEDRADAGPQLGASAPRSPAAVAPGRPQTHWRSCNPESSIPARVHASAASA